MVAREIARYLLAAAMSAIGVLHFVRPDPFVQIVPRALPAPLMLVYISGFFEIAGGVGLLVPLTARWAAWGLIALYLAVFPANINMAIHHISPGPTPLPTWALWGRLPFQAVLIAWAWWYT
jgi:uncharacterized membrane protein